MTTRTTRTLLGALTAATCLSAASAASAEVKLYDWPDATAPVVVVSDQSVIFLHKDGKPYRAYKSGRGGYHVTDIDKNGGPDIVGMGRPTFAIGTNADPLWVMKKGCKIGLVADFVADDKLDVACSNGREFKVYTHDNQFVWSLAIGRSFKKCRAGDVNGDLKADIECKVGSRYARIDGGGELITAEGEDELVADDAENYEAFAAVGEEVITDEQTFDLDGDGTPEEYLLMDGSLLVIKSRSKPKPLSMIDIKVKPEAALVKNLDGEGAPEIVVVTSKEIFVLSPDGKRQERYSLNASRYKRKPLADFQSVYANGFEDDEAASKAILAMQDDLSKCYAREVKKSGFAGSGQLLLQVQVDGEGAVKSVDRLHSEIADKSVVKCAMGKLKKATPGKASGDSATINVTMTYTFRDQ